MTDATPRPWSLKGPYEPHGLHGVMYLNGPDSQAVAMVHVHHAQGRANAALIVSAVNERDAHERCVKFLREMVEAAEKGHIDSEQLPGEPEVGLRPYKWHEEWTHYAKEALAALEKANG